MEIILLLLCVGGIGFFVAEVEGPFGIVARMRNILMRIPYIGTFFYDLQRCSFCLGMHAGWITYLLYAPYITWNIWELLIWAFAGGMFNMLLQINLYKENN
jgi:hypothetical protein